MIFIDAEQLQDGLYNIKDGKIYKYKLENRPQGEWILLPTDPLARPIGNAWYKCSVCKGRSFIASPYCPMCGAKMKQ